MVIIIVTFLVLLWLAVRFDGIVANFNNRDTNTNLEVYRVLLQTVGRSSEELDKEYEEYIAMTPSQKLLAQDKVEREIMSITEELEHPHNYLEKALLAHIRSKTNG